MKVEDIFNYLISHSLNRVCEPHEKFENFHVNKGFLKKDVINVR
jgi:hypothetical protein